MEAALGADADDYRDEGDVWMIYTPIEQFHQVTVALEEAKLPIQESKLAYVPKTKKTITGRDAEVCLNLIDVFDDHDDVQNVFADFDVPDEELQRITAS